MRGEPALLFIHIQKTAGLSLQRILRSNLGPSPTARAVNLAACAVGLKKSRKLLSTEEQIRTFVAKRGYLIGHFGYGVHRLLDRPHVYATMLRDPVERLVSLYNYSRSEPTAFYHKAAVSSTPEQFFFESGLRELDNGKLRYLIGNEKTHFIAQFPWGGATRSMVEDTIARMESEFCMVGTVEHFDLSLLWLADCVGLKRMHYLRINEGSRRSHAVVRPSPETVHRLREQSEWDQMLHGWAEKRLDEMAVQPGWCDRVSGFQEENRRYQERYSSVHQLYSRAKARFKGLVGYKGY